MTAEMNLGIKWILVEGGPGGDFYISATAVTFEQYDAFCDATGQEKPEAYHGRGKQPVVSVSVDDAIAFCNWIGEQIGKKVRLPEEDEWEFAAKGGKKGQGYEYSGSDKLDEVGWYHGNSGNKTHEVATKSPNELGFYDMSGNVWEWCGTEGFARGGCYSDSEHYGECRASSRVQDCIGSSIGDCTIDVGFRLLQEGRRKMPPRSGKKTETIRKFVVTAEMNLGIKWIFVEGGPTGSFSMSATQVTFEQYDAFCEATGYRKPEAEFGRGKHPVINVNVLDAVAFCDWMSKQIGEKVRLPEEDEWEFAAGGGKKGHGYEYSGSNNLDEVGWYHGNSGNKTHEVATKSPNELGLYDMSGNVWEWCGTAGSGRGGSWNYGCDDDCRVFFPLESYSVRLRDNVIGFRLLQEGVGRTGS